MTSKFVILQNCIFFYQRFDKELFAIPAKNCSIDEKYIHFTGDGRIDLDTLFNSFFLAPWQTWTTLRFVELEIEFSGSIEISTLLHNGDSEDGVSQVVPIHHSQPPQQDVRAVWRTRLVDLSSRTFDSGGRISLSLAGNAGATISAVRFVTPDQPARDVRLSLGICSFNRPQNIEAVLRTFSAAEHTPVSHLIVVDQGDQRIDQQTLAKIDLPDSLELLHLMQGNFGGAGGFTRSMLEAIALADHDEAGPTHHIMMDDDAVAHSDQWTRIAAFFGFCRGTCAIGGPMLELETPWRLHEAGIIFPNDQRRRSIGCGLDVRQSGARDRLHQRLDIDAHGWWCWGAPVAVLKECGAPLNLFIKYDDIEYTHRLKKLGVATAVLPGASVWHEAFAHKPSDWRCYYTLRNEAIFQALHEPTPAWRTSPVWNSILPPILRHDPLTAHLGMDALNDFLSGPDIALPADPTGLHLRLMARYKKLAALYGDRPPGAHAVAGGSVTAVVPNQRSDWQTAKTRMGLFVRMVGCQIRFMARRRRAQAQWRAHLQTDPGRENNASYAAWQRLFSAAQSEPADT